MMIWSDTPPYIFHERETSFHLWKVAQYWLAMTCWVLGYCILSNTCTGFVSAHVSGFRVLGAWISDIMDALFLVRGSCVHGMVVSWFWALVVYVLGSWILFLGYGLLVLGCSFLVLGSGLFVLGSGFWVVCSWFWDQCPLNKCLKWETLALKSC